MAYVPDSLQLIVPGMTGTDNKIWALNSTDTIADINTENYISDGVTLGMRQGELVVVKTRASLPMGAVTAMSLCYVADVGTGSDNLGVDLTNGLVIPATDSD